MIVRPSTFREACAFVKLLHRHNKAPRGHKFSVRLVDEAGKTVAVAMFVRVKALPARGSWAESSKKLRAIRDPVGNGGVERVLWECRR